MSFTKKIVIGALVSAALAAAPASAGGRYYGGYPGGYHGGGYYGGGYYNNGGNVAAALIGGLLFGGLIGAAASSSKANAAPPPPPPVPNGYAQSAYVAQGNVAPGYAPPGTMAVAEVAPDAATAQVEMCSRAAERTAQSNGGFARVVAIQGIDGNQANAQVRGTLEINPGNGGAVTTTAFTCAASYGTVTGVRLG